jgi:capsular polysaccharide biosynthesis protein
MSLQSDLRAFALKTGIRTDQVVRKVCLDLTRDLVRMTPVDTGMARSNYFFGMDRVRDSDPTASKNGAPSLVRSATFAGTLKAGGTFYITNNLPYILQITQYGTSKQAAPGSITKLTSDWQRRLDRIAGSV